MHFVQEPIKHALGVFELSQLSRWVQRPEILYNIIWCDIWYAIWYDIFNCNWVDTRWQWYSRHLHTNNTYYVEQHNRQKQHNRHKQYTEQHNLLIRKSADRASSLRSTLAFALQLRKKHGKTSVRIARECQLARYTEQNIHVNKIKEVTLSLGDWYPTFRDHHFTSKHRTNPSDAKPRPRRTESSRRIHT
jgi:hypothetical protein